MRRGSGFNIVVCITFVVGVLLCHQLSAQKSSDSTSLEQLFTSPPPEASPWVFWYWMQASVSREGITADLKAMKEAGIGGAYLMPIKGPASPPYMDSLIVQLTPEWWEMIKHAVKEAKRFGIKLGFHVSDGFALAGGPWITPELSMKKVVWSQIHVKGGNINTVLPQPETLENYYKDIAIFAYPSFSQAGISSSTIKPVITSSKPDSAAQLLATPGNTRNFNCDDQCWIQYEFAKPFSCKAIVIRSRTNYQSNRLIVQVSDDGKTFRTVRQLEPPRHGWQDWDEDYTHAIPPTTAKFFRFAYDKAGSEPGAEDLDAAKWRPSLKIAGIELLSEPRIHQYEGKNGSVWRIAGPTIPKELPNNVCIPVNKILKLTDSVDPAGRLVTKLPAGNWTILRMGYTSTGHKNETAGGGKGLECDKFNPVAVTLQFDKWFGEIMRQTGADKDVIEFLHVDSWECGSQNWSSDFADEFKKRRGYDLLTYLPVMAGIPIMSAEASETVLRDIRTTIAELVNDKFYVTLRDLAHKAGVQLSAESVAPTMVGDGMLHYKSSDIPMGEFWLRSPTHDKPNDMLDAISGAHIYGKRIIQAEGFTQLRMAWDEHPGMLKTLLDRNFALGINRLFFHVLVHNPWMDRKPGMTLDAIGLYFQRDQTWWKQSRAFVDYVRRCQALLQAGQPVVDIAVYTGGEIPRRAILPDRLVPVLPGIFGNDVVQSEQKRLGNAGLPLRQLPQGVTHSANMADPENWIDPLRGYKYDSYNMDAMLNLSSVENGSIKLSNGMRYKLLVLPGDNKRLHATTIYRVEEDRIRDLAAKGAPILKNGRRDTQLNNKIWWGPYKDSTFAMMGVEPDFIARDESGRRAPGIAWTHRAGEGFDIYFISNQQDSARRIEISLRITGRIPELWDPLHGTRMVAADWNTEPGRTDLLVYLEANGSLFVVLKRSQPLDYLTGRQVNWYTTQSIQAISPPWTVTFDSTYGGPATPVVTKELSDWSQSADTRIRYYSGTASYETTLNWSEQHVGRDVWLNVGTVHNIAEVFVNGISCGIAWTAPYRVNISKALKTGTNNIRIEVSNTWANRLIGDRLLPAEKRITNTIAPYRLEGKPLLPAGLLGPVSLEVVY